MATVSVSGMMVVQASAKSSVQTRIGQKPRDCDSASSAARPAQARPIRNRRWSPARSAAKAMAGVTTTRTNSGAAVTMAISRGAEAGPVEPDRQVGQIGADDDEDGREQQRDAQRQSARRSRSASGSLMRPGAAPG